MQISEAWLREFVNPALDTKELVAQLTMAGLEVDAVTPAAADFSGVVVAEVISLEQHPDADRLRVCQVNIGEDQLLQIVCGASNVRAGLKIPAALIGAVLPGDFKIRKSRLRGVESSGMLCSEKELGLATESSGLMELPEDAPVGADIREYLSLNDQLIELDLTPNRADCLSVEGIAREVAVLNQLPIKPQGLFSNPLAHQETLTVNVHAPEACPRYLGRIIKNLNPSTPTPNWMQERLRRSGLRSLGPLIDVTNYVLLELGQPLHAFDATKLAGQVHVRWAHNDEELTLLNGATIKLDEQALVIADDNKALALAGIMGGNDSAVTNDTTHIFLECAFFAPQSIAGKARRFGLHTDSSHRFERGVDATLQHRAIERATQLILEIAGGDAGPITEVTAKNHIPARNPVLLRKQRLEHILSCSFADQQITDIFTRLGMTVSVQENGWLVTPPGFRFDIAIEADLIEEIARVYGYNNLPNNSLLMRSDLTPATETRLSIERAKDLLVDRGYQEAITYSFVDESIQKQIAPNDHIIPIQNPISSELAVMRSTLWCGLLKAALYNTHRQQNRVRFFETGLCFSYKNNAIEQQNRLAGLALGSVVTEQWGEKSRSIDFFDVKADVEALFHFTGQSVHFKAATHPSLHPGQSAQILNAEGENTGWLGMLHPNLEKQLGFDTPVFLFELDQQLLLQKCVSSFKPLSKYPSVRRDLALLVNEAVTADDILNCIKNCQEPLLKDILLFDIYRGKGIENNSKSVALAIVLQNDMQTLTDSEIDAIFTRVLDTLTQKLGAKLRD